MAKFKKGDKVRVKDNPTRAGGGPSWLNPGDIMVVWDGEPDFEGDIRVYPEDSGDCNWDYISEDSVESAVPDIHVGDRVRVYNKSTEITIEGVVREIELSDDHKWLWTGKGYDIAADLNAPEEYDIAVLQRAFKWPDHEGFIRITGGPRAGERAIAYTYFEPSDIALRFTDGAFIPDYDALAHDPDFDFEYVEG